MGFGPFVSRVFSCKKGRAQSAILAVLYPILVDFHCRDPQKLIYTRSCGAQLRRIIGAGLIELACLRVKATIWGLTPGCHRHLSLSIGKLYLYDRAKPALMLIADYLLD